jgi:phage shock protein C
MSTTTPTPGAGPATTPRRRLVRPTYGRVFGGVCAGLADYLGWSRTLVRVLSVASIILPGPQVLAYVILWILVPDEAKARQG